MPLYLYNMQVFKTLWPMLFLVTILALVSCFLFSERGNRKTIFVTVMAFSSLGLISGYLTGFSREPAMSALIPSVLSFMSGILLFLITKGKNSTAVSLSVVVFSFLLMLGAQWGSVMRHSSSTPEAMLIEKQQEILLEMKLRSFREQLEKDIQNGLFKDK